MTHTENTLIEILYKEVVLALGCTEPAAVALASAWAAKAVGETPKTIMVSVDKNIYKNGLGVGVPGTGEVGLHIAAAAGAVGGDPSLGLKVLQALSYDDVQRAKQLVAENAVSIQIRPDAHDVYVDATVTTEHGMGRASIRGRHDNVITVFCNDQVFPEFQRTENDTVVETLAASPVPHDIQQFVLKDLFDFIRHVPVEALAFLRTAISTNKTFAEKSQEQQAMVGIGSKIQQLIARGLMSDDLVGRIKRWVASAVEARMEGLNIAVMSCAGSGNQGLVATLPVVLAAEHASSDEEQLLRATALSYLITVYVKSFMGTLTPVCGGSVAAGMGASCAMTYLFGGDLADIERAVKNMAGSLMGMSCDGAKIGCALKTTMAVSVAVDNTLLALEGITVPTGDGIVYESADHTIRNMGFVTNPGMSQTDDAILEVMTRQHP